MLIFSPFAVRFLPGIEEFIQVVDHNVKLRISRGEDPAAVYAGVIQDVFAEVRNAAQKERDRVESMSPPGEAVDGRLTLPLSKLLDPNTTPLAKRRRRNMLDGVNRNVVYVVRDGDAVLYVGCTRSNARRRIREHLSGKSPFGQAIKRERPRSNEWTAEMIAHPDHQSALATEKRLTDEYKPRYCAAYAQPGDQTTCHQSYKEPRLKPLRRRYLAP